MKRFLGICFVYFQKTDRVSYRKTDWNLKKNNSQVLTIFTLLLNLTNKVFSLKYVYFIVFVILSSLVKIAIQNKLIWLIIIMLMVTSNIIITLFNYLSK